MGPVRRTNFDLEKIKTKVVNYFAIFLLIVLFSSLIRSIQKAKQVKERIQSKQVAVEKAAKENEELKKKLQEVQSPQFIEKQLRDKLGYAKEGEIVVVLPDEETLRSLVPDLEEEEDTLPDPNWKRWLKLFF